MEQLNFLRPISKLRLLQLYYHNCHNLTKGIMFQQDHAFFAESYDRAENDYDSLVEYMIATLGNEAFNTATVIKHIAEELSEIKVEEMSSQEMYIKALELEVELYEELTELNDTSSRIGLINLIGDIATASDVRKYKMQQRLK